LSQIVLAADLAGEPVVGAPSDLYAASVELHLDFADGFTDISGKNRTVTAQSGTVTVSGGVANMLGGFLQSNNVDGGLTINSGQDFTLEIWGKATDFNNRGIFGTSTGGNKQILGNESAYCLTSYWDGYLWQSVANPLVPNQEFMFSISRLAGVARLHWNGLFIASNAGFSSTSFVADWFGYCIYRNQLPGILRRVRVTRGVGRYDGSNFVPPFLAKPDAVLSMNFDGGLVDTSASAGAVINSGVTINTALRPSGAGCAFFNGSSSFSVGPTVVLDSPLDFSKDDYTIVMWIYPTSVSGLRRLFTQQSGGNEGLVVARLNGAALEFFQFTSGGSNAFGVTKSGITINAWNQLVCVVCGNKAFAFVNGVSASGSFASLRGNPNPSGTTIGGYWGGEEYSGYMGSLLAYRYAAYVNDFTPPPAPN
jgi:hypothetical protein